MFELYTAIYDHFKADPLFTSAVHLTDLYDTEAPADAVFPYGTVAIISDIPDFTFTEDFEDCLVQFNLFSKKTSAEELGILFNLLKGDAEVGEGFDYHDLTFIDNFQPVSLVRVNAGRIKVEKVWQYNVLYRCVLQVDGVVARTVINKFMYNLMSI